MSLPLQLIVVGAIVAGAAAYVIRASWKTWFHGGQPSCGSGCGSCTKLEQETTASGRRPLPMA